MLVDSIWHELQSCHRLQRNILSEAWCVGKYSILLVMFVYDNLWYFLFFVIDLVYGLSLIACGLHFHCVLNQVICTLGSVVFVCILLIRGLWTGVTYLQESRYQKVNEFDDDRRAWTGSQPAT